MSFATFVKCNNTHSSPFNWSQITILLNSNSNTVPTAADHSTSSKVKQKPFNKLQWQSTMQEINPENKSVPWKGIDVLLFLSLFAGKVLWCLCIGYIAAFSFPLSHLYWMDQFVKADNITPMLFGFLAIVAVAPLIEEFVFRMLLQRWLQAKFRQFRIPFASSIAVVITSFLFAAAHVSHTIVMPMDYYYTHVTQVILSLSLFAFGIIYLVRKRNVQITQYLFGTDRFFRPRFFIKAGYCLLALLLLFILDVILFSFVNIKFRVLITVFLLSLILGTLYSRSQNLSYCILLHAFYNGIMFSLHFFSSLSHMDV